MQQIKVELAPGRGAWVPRRMNESASSPPQWYEGGGCSAFLLAGDAAQEGARLVFGGGVVLVSAGRLPVYYDSLSRTVRVGGAFDGTGALLLDGRGGWLRLDDATLAWREGGAR